MSNQQNLPLLLLLLLLQILHRINSQSSLSDRLRLGLGLGWGLTLHWRTAELSRSDVTCGRKHRRSRRNRDRARPRSRDRARPARPGPVQSCCPAPRRHRRPEQRTVHPHTRPPEQVVRPSEGGGGNYSHTGQVGAGTRLPLEVFKVRRATANL